MKYFIENVVTLTGTENHLCQSLEEKLSGNPKWEATNKIVGSD